MNQLSKSTPAKATFLDANVLLEIILGRNKESIAREFLEVSHTNLFISSLTAHLVVHFGQAIVELPVLREFLADYTILNLEAADFEWAFTNARNRDFEDALQIGVAIRNGCTNFLTFDKQLYEMYNDLFAIHVELLV